jgi:hypothetical protein
MGPTPVSKTRTTDLRELTDQLSLTLESVFAPLEVLRAGVESLFAEIRDDGRAVRIADLQGLDPTIKSHLGGADGLVVGTGFIAAPAVLDDQALWLQWWRHDGVGAPSRLDVDLDPASDRYCDYTELPWFVVPRETGGRHITGPYVDLLCSDEYALTFTMPVYDRGRFVGVVGSDVYVRAFEPVILPPLRDLGVPAALVNAQGRVTVATTIRRPVGSLVRRPDVPALWESGRSTVTDGGVTLHRCGEFPMALLVGEGLTAERTGPQA